MTPRQRAYKLAGEKGAIIRRAPLTGAITSVGVSNGKSARIEYRQGPGWGGLEPADRLWRRVCAALEEMPDDQG